MVDLLYAHYSPAEASAALLSLKSLVITAGNGTAVSVYQVLAATLVPGQRLDFVVTAPAAAAAGASANAADLMRIVIDDAGVHEVRSGAQQAGRRLLVAATTAGAAKTVQGLVYDVTAPTCSECLCCWGLGPAARCARTRRHPSCPSSPSCPLPRSRVRQSIGRLADVDMCASCRHRLLRRRRQPDQLPRGAHLRRQRQAVHQPLRGHRGRHHRALHQLRAHVHW